MVPFLSLLVLKGSNPSTATMDLFTANDDSMHKGLSSSVPLLDFRKLGHDHIWAESKFVVMISIVSLPIGL